VRKDLLVRAHPDIGRDIVGFRRTDQRMEQQAVDGLERNLLEILMGAMHGVPRLETDNGLPAFLVHQLPCFARCQAVFIELRVFRTLQHLHRTTEEHVALGKQPGHARVRLVSCAKALPGFT
jgi:hypothetical protein